MYISETQVRVRYAETDQMNVVYHGNYAQYFEVARAESIRQLGFSYKDMEAMGVIKPVAARTYEFIPWTPVFNVTGQPAMSVPLHWNAEGLPIGMHFVGKWGDEATLFRLAGQLEKAKPWFDKAPVGY